jgi:fucose permease
MSHRRLRIIVAVLVLAFTFMALVSSVRAMQLPHIETRAELTYAPYTKTGGGFLIMGGCEGSAGGCPWD